MTEKKLIDFSKIKWGTLTQTQKRYEKKHPEVKTVKQFAHLVEKHPKDFSKTTQQRARFFVNILEKK